MSEEFWKPAEAARKLGMPPSTLRVYSTKFTELLSETASNPPVTADGRTGHRLYCDRDLVILAKAKEALGRGLTYEQALGELRPLYASSRSRGRPGGAGNGSVANGAAYSNHIEALIAPLVASIQSAQKAAESWQALAVDRAKENEELRERIRSIESKVDRLEERWNQLIRRIEEESVRQPGLLGRVLGR